MELSGSIVIEQIRSEALAGNLCGDPTERRVPVYLPPSYAQARGRRYPAVYCLHGFTGTGAGWLNENPLQPSLPERADRLMREGRCEEMILVMPDGWSRFGGGQYLNTPTNGRHQDHIADEVVAHIDRVFRTRPAPEARGVLGKSSGGYGALMLAMQRPDRFRALACHSGDMYFELCYKPDFPKFLKAVERAGGLEAFVTAYPASAWRGQNPGDVLAILGMAAAYSPNPARPPAYCDLPLDLETGELDEAVWQRWLAHDPVYLVERYAAALRQHRLLYFDAGTRDEYNLQYGARILTRRLAALGIPHVYEEFDGGHGNTGFRYEESLPRLAAALGA